MKIAILDDYQHLARRLADWSKLENRCSIDVFDRKLGDDELNALDGSRLMKSSRWCGREPRCRGR